VVVSTNKKKIKKQEKDNKKTQKEKQTLSNLKSHDMRVPAMT
jgi:hypothetical protein